MSIYKRGGCNKNRPNGTCSKCGKRGSCGTYWYKFQWQGKLIRKSTHQGNDKVARQIEAAHRTSLAKGEVGIREKKQVTMLAEFLRKDFLPYTEGKFKSKSSTRDYYAFGAKRLLNSGMANLRLNEITDQHAAQFAARNSALSPSTINCGLRTLRRALNLAYQWGKLERPTKITLARGEHQRERVVSDVDFAVYLDLCPQPWRDIALLVRGTGMRPGECYKLRWEHVLLNGSGGLVFVAEGKSRAARRQLPMVPAVYAALRARHRDQGEPETGWLFPTGSASGHVEQGSLKNGHSKALRQLQLAHMIAEKQKGQRDWMQAVADGAKLDPVFVADHADVIRAGVVPFEPYCLRHTALTRLAESGCDAFTLARIAGHSSITITQRYCHPQADAVERAFAKLAGGHNSGHNESQPLLPQQTETAATVSVKRG